MNPGFLLFRRQIMNPARYRLFLLAKLPMGFLAGLKVVELQENKAIVSLRYKYITQNPFRSIYFAALSMAAELSTGILGFANIFKRNPPVSMLVIKMQGEFYKKAVGKIKFTCYDGKVVEDAVELTLATGEGVVVNCTSVGLNEQDEEVAKFIFTWSFKAKSNQTKP